MKGNKPGIKRIMQKGIKKLIKINLIVTFFKNLGKDNGVFNFIKQVSIFGKIE
ncbi:hypothetical protein BSV1_M46 (plasmid) [Borreliella finlandensis]|uniref:Uncharacterized protein n=1 Tax=Borreliella finlandensis TaxID=498741 RepID=A0A826GU60_9SPIR|nr:hypothetical protein [Borreliella finlandensis]EEH00270.1 hypothetical protein BSV1_M46 [Borreliella finlandensis]